MIAKKKTKQMQQEITENAHQIWLAGLGAVAMAQEGGGKLFKNLVKRGESVEQVGRDKVGQAVGAVSGVKVVAESYWETFERTLDDKVTTVIHRIGVPTKDEIDTLTERVEKLTAAIDKLRVAETPKPAARAASAATTSAAAKAPAKKATATKTGTAKKAPAKKTVN